MEKSFQDLKYYHVLRIHNKKADIEANKVVLIFAGTKNKEDEESWEPIP